MLQQQQGRIELGDAVHNRQVCAASACGVRHMPAALAAVALSLVLLMSQRCYG
jgi:hypothetical protein